VEAPMISIILPVYNEEKSLRELYEEIIGQMALDDELIFVDDHSTDGSWSVLRELKERDQRIRVFHLDKKSGKTACLKEGFRQARGGIFLTLDSDLQDDPFFISAFLLKISEGYDCVCGWRQGRKDSISKNIFSFIFNNIVSLVLSLELHDINCGMKAFRREAVCDISLESDMHRFLPLLVFLEGRKVTELKIHNRKRKYGVSKYGWERYVLAAFDFFRILKRLVRKRFGNTNGCR
jgi:dolichol-phosphate mannosyltransferase